jgi:hypothetical protein
MNTYPKLTTAIGWLIVAILFFSCSNTKRATKHLGKALTEDRNFVLDTLRKLSPCVTTARDTVVNTIVKSHTDTAYKTEVVNISCPDSAGVKIIRQVEYKIRTITNTDSFYVNRDITVTKRDMSDSIHDARIISALTKDVTKYSKKSDRYFNWWIAFLVAFLVSLMVNIIQFKTRKA